MPRAAQPRGRRGRIHWAHQVAVRGVRESSRDTGRKTEGGWGEGELPGTPPWLETVLGQHLTDGFKSQLR